MPVLQASAGVLVTAAPVRAFNTKAVPDKENGS